MSTTCGASIFSFELLKKKLENICCPSYEMNAGSKIFSSFSSFIFVMQNSRSPCQRGL